MTYGLKGKQGKIDKIKGTLLVLSYVAYNSYLGMSLI
jgi:cation:H+ antiporter